MTFRLEGRRIALVGGAGFIGHNLALALKASGAEVSVIDGLQVNNLLAFSSKPPDFQNRDLYLKIINERLRLLQEANVPLIVQDARDYHAISKVLGDLNPQVIVHLAAVAHAGQSNKDPFSTFDHSLRTLENTLDVARGVKLEHFVYLSSSMVYGDFKTEEVDEEHPLNPIGIYGALKLAGEKLVIAYNQVFGLPYTIIRPSALYGPRCVSRRVGQIFIENALAGTKLRVEGDGKEKVDFTFIEDLIEGLKLVVTHPEARNQLFNLTYGSSRSIQDLVNVLRQHFPDAQEERVDRDRLMPVRGTLSVAKARRMLGYAPRFPIEEGFARYVEWYRSLLPPRKG